MLSDAKHAVSRTCRNVVSNETSPFAKRPWTYKHRRLRPFAEFGHSVTRENVQWLEPSDVQTKRLHEFIMHIAQGATFYGKMDPPPGLIAYKY